MTHRWKFLPPHGARIHTPVELYSWWLQPTRQPGDEWPPAPHAAFRQVLQASVPNGTAKRGRGGTIHQRSSAQHRPRGDRTLAVQREAHAKPALSNTFHKSPVAMLLRRPSILFAFLTLSPLSLHSHPAPFWPRLIHSSGYPPRFALSFLKWKPTVWDPEHLVFIRTACDNESNCRRRDG